MSLSDYLHDYILLNDQVIKLVVAKSNITMFFNSIFCLDDLNPSSHKINRVILASITIVFINKLDRR